jgi:hypothetical protein
MAQDYTSIRVTEAAKEAAEESKRDGETWNEYLQRCTENPPVVREFVDADGVGEQLDRLESSASTIEERTGRIEQALEDMGARR